MANSPLNRGGLTSCTQATPTRAPGTTPRSEDPTQENDVFEGIPTPEIQNWMSSIEQYLNEVCTIATEGKLNSDQKLRISALCRRVGHGTSQMAVQYQALKAKIVKVQSTNKNLKDKLDLSERLQDLKQTIEESSKPSTGTSFADMVKKGTNNYIQPTNLSSVAIYPNDKLQSSEETKSLVQKIICPEKMKLHVRGVRKTKNGGVIISTDTKDDAEKLKKSVQLTDSGLTIDEPHKRKPRVVVIGVPTSMPEKEVFACLYHQNLADKLQDSCSLDSFLNLVKLSHKSGKRDAETCNYVIEVSAAVRKALITNDRVFINWSSCPVRDFTLVTRCYKCQQYGHAAKSCREVAYTCGHCGNLGHSTKECQTTTEARCATCLRFKKPCDHSTGAIDCPAKIIAERRYINSIDYGGTSR